MKKIIPLSAALLLSLSLSGASLAQGKGNDKEHGPDKHEGRGNDRGKGNDGHPGKGGGKGERADKDHGKNGDGKNGKSEEWVLREFDRRSDRDGRQERRDRDRDDRIVVLSPDREITTVVLVPYRERVVIAGCPPGLAKKNNGCLPPGQAKKLERARYDWLWSRPAEDYRYRYDDGYVYRYNPQGSLLGYLPALGGALSVGNIWPSQYRYDPAPAYQTQYYGLNQPYDYRYADGAIYGVDPKTSSIQQVVALLTGQSANVGQQMPAGYDVYNVPYAYRSQYADTPTSAYRYNDGSLYQIDPKTQVIQQIIKMLT